MPPKRRYCARSRLPDASDTCAALVNSDIADTAIWSASVIAAGRRPLPPSSVRYAREHGLPDLETPELPAFCRVRGYVRPAINFEIRLPVADWNGKIFMAGCGGLCGQLLPERPGYSNGINTALVKGYAVVTTDAGHWGASAVDGVWAYHDRLAEIDWAYRAIPEVARVTSTVIQRYYGQAQNYSCFSGCSNGGRMGALAAQRYPELFDGIIIGAPALDWRTLVMHGVWMLQANVTTNGDQILELPRVGLIAKAVMKHCDGTDGLEDGLISDPRRCDFDPGLLACAPGVDKSQCLSAAEVEVVRKWYGGPPHGHGDDWDYSLAFGSEPYWPAWLTPLAGARGAIELFATDLLRYVLFEHDPGPAYSILEFDLESQAGELDFMRELTGAYDTGLHRFRAAGGRRFCTRVGAILERCRAR